VLQNNRYSSAIGEDSVAGGYLGSYSCKFLLFVESD